MPDETRTEEIEIQATWKSTHRVTVPYGWRPTGSLDDFPEGVLDAMTTADAELVDWQGPRFPH